MNRLIILPSFFLYVLSFGQTIRKIVDKENSQPIPYASLKVLHHPRGTISSALGEFMLEILPVDTLVITSVGYEDLTLPGTEIKSTIMLTRKANILPPVLVDRRLTRITLPTQKSKFSRDLQWGPGVNNNDEFAQRIYISDSVSQIRIRRVIIPVDKFTCWGPLMIRIYLEDTAGLPGEMIFSQEFTTFEKKNRMAFIDVSGFDVFLDRSESFFVSVSWTPTVKNSRFVTTLVLSKEANNETYSRSLNNINYSWYPFGKFTDNEGGAYSALMFLSVEADIY
jgi:hypothetical protein